MRVYVVRTILISMNNEANTANDKNIMTRREFDAGTKSKHAGETAVRQLEDLARHLDEFGSELRWMRFQRETSRRILARWCIWLLTKECPSEVGAAVASLWGCVLAGDEPSRQEWIQATTDAYVHGVARFAALLEDGSADAATVSELATRATVEMMSYERQAEALLRAYKEEGARSLEQSHR